MVLACAEETVILDQTVNILIVDDDSVDIRMVTRALKNRNISNPLHTAKDGVEALEMLRGENGCEPLPRPFIILLDLNMPRMNGIEFLESIRQDEDLSGSIVFVLTTSNDDRDKCAAYKKNVAGYILKSEAGDDFINLVSMLESFVLTVQFPPTPTRTRR